MPDNEQLINESFWSLTYKDSNFLYKYIKFNNFNKLLREVKYSRLAYKNEIPTSKCVAYGFSNKHNSMFIQYCYYELEEITCDLFLGKSNISDIILNKIKSINEVNVKDIKDNYWKNNMLKEFSIVLNEILKPYLENSEGINYNVSRKTTFLESLKMVSFIHGDFSLSNIFLHNNNVFIIDFEHGCIGPDIWDKCYLLATIAIDKRIYNFLKLLTHIELELVLIISEIRLARALKKSFLVSERLKSYKLIYNYLEDK